MKIIIYVWILTFTLCISTESSALETSVTGDFNGDSETDIVIGNFKAKVNGKESGAVQIQYGDDRGIAFGRVQNLNQESPGIPGAAAGTNQFGFAVAKGDFDNDGFDDLVIGAPGNDVLPNGSTVNDAGNITAVYGSFNGLQTNQRVQLLTQNSPGIMGAAEKNDNFGEVLATGDFNGDGFDDLAVSATGESIESRSRIFVGAINIIPGSSTGLSSAGGQIWTLEDLGYESENHDKFGIVTATGDFNNDGFDDLAIGAPFKDVGSKKDSGVLYIVYGSSNGLHPIRARSIQRWMSGSNNFPVEARKDLNLARSLAVGNFNGDDFDDLAIGITGDNRIVVLKGGSGGLVITGRQILTPNSSGMPGKSGIGKDFAWNLTARDINSDGFDDLFVAATGAPIDGSTMISLTGSENGLNTVRARYWSFRSLMQAYPQQNIKLVNRFDHRLKMNKKNRVLRMKKSGKGDK